MSLQVCYEINWKLIMQNRHSTLLGNPGNSSLLGVTICLFCTCYNICATQERDEHTFSIKPGLI
jgi:hypothetical protein